MIAAAILQASYCRSRATVNAAASAGGVSAGPTTPPAHTANETDAPQVDEQPVNAPIPVPNDQSGTSVGVLHSLVVAPPPDANATRGRGPAFRTHRLGGALHQSGSTVPPLSPAPLVQTSRSNTPCSNTRRSRSSSRRTHTPTALPRITREPPPTSRPRLARNAGARIEPVQPPQPASLRLRPRTSR